MKFSVVCLFGYLLVWQNIVYCFNLGNLELLEESVGKDLAEQFEELPQELQSQIDQLILGGNIQAAVALLLTATSLILASPLTNLPNTNALDRTELQDVINPTAILEKVKDIMDGKLLGEAQLLKDANLLNNAQVLNNAEILNNAQVLNDGNVLENAEILNDVNLLNDIASTDSKELADTDTLNIREMLNKIKAGELNLLNLGDILKSALSKDGDKDIGNF